MPDIPPENLPPSGAPSLLVTVVAGEAPESEKRFDSSFLIGRSKECDFQLLDICVGRRHLEVTLDRGRWTLKDLGSVNHTFVNGVMIEDMPLSGATEVELGRGGPRLTLTVQAPEPLKEERPEAPERKFTSETQIIRHLEGANGKPAGEETLMFRRAFARLHKKKSRKYHYAIACFLLLLVAAASVITYQTKKLHRLRSAAEDIFYTTKTLDLEIANLEKTAAEQGSQRLAAELQEKRQRLKQLEQEYDGFVKEIGVYKKIPPEERIILQVARIFGECDVNVPREFVAEVKRYIGIWKRSDRLGSALHRARVKGYSRIIPRVLTDNNLPPQYFYLALQESNFDERAVGRLTRYGYAKGMWQFIPVTAKGYGLKLGPLTGKGVYDPQDERCNGVKSTVAAMKYIRDLTNTEAQASGLLVMASYNWGESNVLDIINRMPATPRQRNFWRFLLYRDIPRETYDYVFLIFSAAVICEDPRLFGFKVECPAFDGRVRKP